jgi:NADH-quinone oxidoreductase subunit L
VVFFPLAGLTINLLLGKRMGERGAGVVASTASGLAFLVSVLLTLALGRNPQPVSIPLLDWITIGSFSVGWTFRVDTLSTTMMLVVSGVGTLIHIYAIGYMHTDVRHNGDPGRYRRFFVYFNLFIAAMMILVSADNYLMLFVGWEGVGLCSYLLIGFWFEKGSDGIGNARAAQKAFVVNRIGDFGLLIAIFLMFWSFGSLDFDSVFSGVQKLSAAQGGVILAITLLMLMGVAGKSAQIPLYVWLPDAMAGPTPVSALIHAATMVTAGVYLVARSQPLFALAPAAQAWVTWIGASTALLAATIAVGQYDIKKVLAYSTISQLGFMVAAVGMGAIVAGMFHLVTHAFFKALLFLSAGSVILGMEHGHGHQEYPAGGHEGTPFDPQDMRNMGGLQKRMPLTFWVYLAGALALAGLAPLAGFFSKDEILAAAAGTSPVIFAMLLLSAFLTAFYMGRQLLMVFSGKGRTIAAEKAVESPPLITVPLVILAALSVLGGAINLPGVLTLEKWLEHTLGHGLAPEFSMPVAASASILALSGLFLAWLAYGFRSLGNPGSADPLEQRLGKLFYAMNHKWWVDEFYHQVIVHPYRYLSQNILSDWFDREVIDGGVNDLGNLCRSLASSWSRIQNGFVRTYALVVLVGVVAMLTYLVTR